MRPIHPGRFIAWQGLRWSWLTALEITSVNTQENEQAHASHVADETLATPRRSRFM